MERSRNSLQPNASASSCTVEPVLTTSALLLTFSVPLSFPPFSLLWPLLQETILTALSGHSVCSSYPAFLPLLHCLTLHFGMTPNSKTQLGSCHLRLLMCFSRDMLILLMLLRVIYKCGIEESFPKGITNDTCFSKCFLYVLLVIYSNTALNLLNMDSRILKQKNIICIFYYPFHNIMILVVYLLK